MLTRGPTSGEYTTPQGDFKILRKGTYASVEDAQIGLKFSLKGGHYAEMIIEGRDITPEFKGTLKVCNDVKYYDAIDDNPIRLYIWTKDLKGKRNLGSKLTTLRHILTSCFPHLLQATLSAFLSALTNLADIACTLSPPRPLPLASSKLKNVSPRTRLIRSLTRRAIRLTLIPVNQHQRPSTHLLPHHQAVPMVHQTSSLHWRSMKNPCLLACSKSQPRRQLSVLNRLSNQPRKSQLLSLVHQLAQIKPARSLTGCRLLSKSRLLLQAINRLQCMNMGTMLGVNMRARMIVPRRRAPTIAFR